MARLPNTPQPIQVAVYSAYGRLVRQGGPSEYAGAIARCGVDSFVTLAGSGTGTYEEKRSAFLGFAFPVSTQDEAAGRLATLRSAHFDARHVAHAFRLVDGAARFSDDGEPSGTAGKPLLTALTGKYISNGMVVVVRYFGGTLLGTGGLTRAYGAAAAAALDDAGFLTLHRACRLRICCDYALFDQLSARLTAMGLPAQNPQYGAEVTAEILVKSAETAALCASLTEWSRGQITPQVLGEEFFSFS